MQIVIDTFGTSVHRKQGAFEIANKDGKKKISPDKLKSIVLNKAAKISADAVLLAIEKEIEVLFVDHTGTPKGRIWSNKFGSVSTIRKNQIDFSRSPLAVNWAKENIIRKINAQIALLQSLIKDRPAKQPLFAEAIGKMAKYSSRLSEIHGKEMGEVAGTIRGLEGNASRTYFQLLGKVVPKDYQFDKRSKHPAVDMFNATLNYVYGMLYGNVEGALIKAGIDPYLGIMHRDEYNRPVLTYDIIERYRVWAEAIVLQMCFRRLLVAEMFEPYNNGLYLAGVGKQLVIKSANDYLGEVVLMHKKKRSRITHLQDEAHQFAKFLLSFNNKN